MVVSRIHRDMHVTHHGIGGEIGIYARHRHAPRRFAAGIGIILFGIHVGQIYIVARMHPHTLGQRLRDNDGLRLRQTPQIALDSAERQHVEQRQRHGRRPVIVTIVVVLSAFHPHILRPQSFIAYGTRTLHIGPQPERPLGNTARRESYPVLGEARQQDIRSVGILDRTVVGNVVIYLRHYHIKGQKGHSHARDVEHRGHFVTPQRGQEILYCNLHGSNIYSVVCFTILAHGPNADHANGITGIYLFIS